MKNLDMKKNLFGYSEEDVQRYVQKLNEEFEQKISEKDEKIVELENRLDDLEKENETYKKQQLEVSAAIINAQNYAEQIKQETRAREEGEREKLEENIANQKRKLEIHIREVDSLRRRVKAVLENIDMELQRTQHKAESLAQVDIMEEIEEPEFSEENEDMEIETDIENETE